MILKDSDQPKDQLHVSRSYEELNDVCFEGFPTLGGGGDNSQKFNSLRSAGQVIIGEI